MRRFVLVAAIALIAAACGGDGDEETTTTTAAAAATTTTTAEETTTTAADETTTTAADETTTTAADETTTTAAGVEGAVFALSEVVFGDDGYVAITNIGTEAGSLSDWWLCQRPSYFGLPPHELAAGDTVFVTARDGVSPDVDGEVISGGGRFGGLNNASGEMGLYLDGNFGSSESIVSYVEWGSAGHGRTGTAVSAGIWVSGDFVASEGATLIRATAAPPLGAADWESG